MSNVVQRFESDRRDLEQRYRAITRHTDGRIIHVKDFPARSDEEAIRIATARGGDFRMDLWSSEGLVRRFGASPS